MNSVYLIFIIMQNVLMICRSLSENLGGKRPSPSSHGGYVCMCDTCALAEQNRIAIVPRGHC